MSQAITVKNASTKLSAIKRSGVSIRANIQLFWMFAGRHYVETGDTIWFTKLYDTLSGMKSFSHNKLAAYTEAHFNVKLRKAKTGDAKVFGKASKGVPPEFIGDNIADLANEENHWFNFEKAAEQKTCDLLKDIDSLIKRIEGGFPDEHGIAKRDYEAEQLGALTTAINSLKGTRASVERVIEEQAALRTRLTIEAQAEELAEERQAEAA